MIQDLDETLKELLIQKVPIDPESVHIKFELPTKEWATGLSKPTINLYLYDLRENQDLRSNQRSVSRAGAIGFESRPPARIDLTYLITVWTVEVADEHRLLGRLLNALLRYPILPDDVLRGDMQTQPHPLHAWIAQPERTPNAWDFWGGLEGRLKAGISYVVTASVEPHSPEELSLVTEKVLKLYPSLET